MVVLKPNIVRGGRAIGLGNNLYLMKGRTHSKGGIDIGKNPKTGLEVENNEVMQVSPQGVRVFSAQPILGGISPAQYILGGANPNQVFNAQEEWKKVNKINDDGTKKAQLGKELYKKKHNVSLIDDIPEHQEPLNYDEIKRRQEFMESEFNSKAYNKKSGAKGRFQIRENALQDYINAGGEKGDLFDSDYNEKVRDWIMENLSKSSMIVAGNPTDSVKMAKQLAAYNWGRGNLSKFLQKQKAAGMDVYRDMSWIDSLPKETRDYVNFSLRNQDINDAKNNERYNSLIKKYGGIHIKPSKRGTFTAAAKKHGMSVQGFASKVLANKGKYSSAMVKKANFARNASKWKHKEFGGDMDFNYWITKDNIYKLGGRKKGQWGLQDYSDSFLLNNDTLGNIGRMKAIRDMKLGTNSFGDTKVPSFTVAEETLKPKVKNTIINSNNDNSGLVAQNLANGIQAAINIGGNIGSYFINRNALRRMRGPAAPLPLRAENLPTRVSTAAQEAALRENVAKQENLLAGNLSSSRSRLNATNQIRNQGIGLYNQLQEKKGEIGRELITRDKLNKQGITNQNIVQVNQWRNAAREFENKRIDLNSENTIQHLIQGPADAIAGERGFFDNLASNDRYRMTAFLEAIKNRDALKAMNSDEIKQLARRFGVRTSWLRSIGINV